MFHQSSQIFMQVKDQACINHYTALIQMKDCVYTNHRPSAWPSRGSVPPLALVKIDCSHLEFTKDCEGKESSANAWNSHGLDSAFWNQRCVLAVSSCDCSVASSRFLWSVQSSRLEYRWFNWLLVWQSFTLGRRGSREGSNSSQLGSQVLLALNILAYLK
jgi:hypothetical protein